MNFSKIQLMSFAIWLIRPLSSPLKSQFQILSFRIESVKKSTFSTLASECRELSEGLKEPGTGQIGFVQGVWVREDY